MLGVLSNCLQDGPSFPVEDRDGYFAFQGIRRIEIIIELLFEMAEIIEVVGHELRFEDTITSTT